MIAFCRLLLFPVRTLVIVLVTPNKKKKFMVLPIYTYGQPVLRKVAADIPLDYPDLQELIRNMFETNTASDGVGLAAPSCLHQRSYP